MKGNGKIELRHRPWTRCPFLGSGMLRVPADPVSPGMGTGTTSLQRGWDGDGDVDQVLAVWLGWGWGQDAAASAGHQSGSRLSRTFLAAHKC